MLGLGSCQPRLASCHITPLMAARGTHEYLRDAFLPHSPAYQSTCAPVPGNGRLSMNPFDATNDCPR
ncbi:hypothetical protein E2C01_032554 [Portunus trituberculatus]|uniref:Uncharacterized protein n=1 Tax=Portunus trituberculatus TaxID=210409 RepID=A0A5B7EZX8_PORTR|nr:hypothetical protein [Portunus trituberculatus]